MHQARFSKQCINIFINFYDYYRINMLIMETLIKMTMKIKKALMLIIERLD